MAVYKDIETLHFDRTAVTVGSFDGVHCGHRMLLQRVTDIAAEHRLRSVALTFWPHPRQALHPDGETPPLLQTLDERISMLEQTGIDDIVVLPFDKALSQMSASGFIKKIIIGKLNARCLVAGQDHHFGKGRYGNVQHLLKFVAHTNLQVEVIDLKLLDRKISSSVIRKALLCGDLALANEMLGYEYMISGKVIDGNHLGRTIGFPTANIETSVYKLLPREGVYRVKVKTGSTGFDRLGMMYIGKRPVLKQENAATHVEVHIFGFDRQIYGQEIALSLTHRIRDDIKFGNVEQLAEQLRRDQQMILSL